MPKENTINEQPKITGKLNFLLTLKNDAERNMAKKDTAIIPKVPTSKPLPKIETCRTGEKIEARKKAATTPRPESKIGLRGIITSPSIILDISQKMKEERMPMEAKIPLPIPKDNWDAGKKKNGIRKIVTAKTMKAILSKTFFLWSFIV